MWNLQYIHAIKISVCHSLYLPAFLYCKLHTSLGGVVYSNIIYCYNYYFCPVTSDVNSFLQRRHKISGKLIEITVCKEPPQHEQEDNDAKPVKDSIIPDTIEVTGEDVSNTAVLEMYFQGLKSGGGRDKEVEWIKCVAEGVVHIKFSSTEGTYDISN